ncbi:VOC family protein [Paraburkholderia lycopersici]|uniref:2,3-dihydroxybiphenyl 1,2-dioxygenase n=1 Tax=Paraburkholderia lycopersici TaxID=416944 RepID=A0A1G6X0E0_9BURK|nr:VOC family protein [Paraburkholderia lycopersici]SDD71561.1 2,3-dihydroxybiphenyl 1,2-dioxygenase [Paraburkholderia lycopersici]
MKIDEIGYVGIDATNTAEWRTFAADYVGFEVRDLANECLGLRMDDYAWRMLVQPAQRNGVGFVGMKVESPEALETVRGELTAAGIAVHESSAAERAVRGVQHMLWALDPDKNRVEFFAGRSTDESEFKPGRPIGGFRTGALGLGHIVLGTPSLEEMEHFYMKLLGFGLSDYLDTEIKVRFIHTNDRHHSLALVKTPVSFLHHVMIEYKFMDDVGRLYDQALTMPGMIQTSLGRHSNDHMFSFYSRTPGGFLLETGWGGRAIDRATWTPEELWCFSLWGHERRWETPENQAKQREQNVTAARLGLLAPVEINGEGGFVNRTKVV